MNYTTELASLRARADVIETILCTIETKQDTINQYKKEEDPDGWCKTQINNMELEIQTLNNIIKIIANMGCK